ncbi:MAG TPA: sigma-70 family RNA polymerase sigma factor [Acidobacteriaceae bacterium]
MSEAIGLLQNTVYSFSMKVCGHPEDAEDTMQEVLLRSLPHLAKITDPRALAVWLYTVTRNYCWRMRRKSVDAPKQTLSLDELMPDELDLALLLQDRGSNPERQILHDEQNLLLHKAILSVPPEYRITLVLHDIENLDTEQIAQILDLQPGTVRVRLHRARLYVRKAMSQIAEQGSTTQTAHKRQGRQSAKRTGTVRRPQQCREIFANLSEYLDNRLEVRTCQEMRQHIDACPACIAFINDLRQAIDRCSKLDMACNSEVAPKLRTMLTREYLRMLGQPASK